MRIRSTINTEREKLEMLNDISITSTEKMKTENELMCKLNDCIQKHQFVEENDEQNDIGSHNTIFFIEY